MQICLRRFPPMASNKRILNSPCLLILLIHIKHKTIRWNFGLTPRFYSLERELIYWVDKVENVWLIVGQLPIKAGWWDAPLELCDYSWSSEQNFFFLKGKINYPFKWIQLIEWSNYLNMTSCLHLLNKLKECCKYLWIRLWNLYFISMKESIFSKVAGWKSVALLNWTPS